MKTSDSFQSSLTPAPGNLMISSVLEYTNIHMCTHSYRHVCIHLRLIHACGPMKLIFFKKIWNSGHDGENLRILRSVRLFCRVLYWWTPVVIYCQNSYVECATRRVDSSDLVCWWKCVNEESRWKQRHYPGKFNTEYLFTPKTSVTFIIHSSQTLQAESRKQDPSGFGGGRVRMGDMA